jgi:hypothetical protein
MDGIWNWSARVSIGQGQGRQQRKTIQKQKKQLTSRYIHTHIHIHIYMCFCLFILSHVLVLIRWRKNKIKSNMSVSHSVSQKVSQSDTALFNALLHVSVSKESSPGNSYETFKPHQHLLSEPNQHCPPLHTAVSAVTRLQTTVCHAHNTSLSHATDILRTVGLNLELLRSKYKQQRYVTSDPEARQYLLYSDTLHIYFNLLRLPCTPLPSNYVRITVDAGNYNIALHSEGALGWSALVSVAGETHNSQQRGGTNYSVT